MSTLTKAFSIPYDATWSDLPAWATDVCRREDKSLFLYNTFLTGGDYLILCGGVVSYQRACHWEFALGTILALMDAYPGLRFRTKDWPSEQFIYQVPGSTFCVNRAPLNVIYPEGTEVQYQAHIDIHYAGTPHRCAPWVISTDDTQARWYIVTE